MLAHARGVGWGWGVQQEPRTGAGPRLPGNFGDSFAPLAFLVLLWGCSRQDIVKVSASQLLSPDPRRDVPAVGPRFPRPPPPAHVPGLGTSRRSFSRTKPRPRGRRRLGPARAPARPPAPLPSSAAREPGCWIPSLRLVLHFHKRAALRRAEIAAAASPRGAPPRRAPSPAPAERAPGLPRGSAAGGEGEERGGGGRLRAVLLRGGERGWGGGRGAGTPLAAAGGFASPRAATRALPASPVAAGARRKEHGEGRGGRSGARRPERGAGRAQHSPAARSPRAGARGGPGRSGCCCGGGGR